MINTFQRDLIQSEISKGDLLISEVEDNLMLSPDSGAVILKSDFKDNFPRMLSLADFYCTLVQDTNNIQIFPQKTSCALHKELKILTKETIQSGKRKTKCLGSTWGIFWKQKRNLIISAPLYKDGSIIAGISIVKELDSIYQAIRRSQQILVIYIFINTFLLTLIGFYRLSKIFLRPINRLVKRAEEYKENEAIFFSARKEDNEFVKLSKSLNSMFNRISEDKEKLRSSVLSLEKVNYELKQAQDDIIRAEKMASVGILSSGIAHEIGNPIGIVLGYLDLLKQKDITEDEKNDFITRAIKEINRINAIIRQLLDLSRPSKEGMQAVSAHEIIKDISNVLNVQPLMSDINLELYLVAKKDTVFADSNRLRQVFLNLMINSADALSSCEKKSDGKLIIKSEVVPGSYDDFKNQGDSLKIMFIDNGPGIPQETLGNIFDPFFTTKEPGMGTGLGLSVSFMIVESLGGKIKAISERGKGITFIIYLPLHEASRESM